MRPRPATVALAVLFGILGALAAGCTVRTRVQAGAGTAEPWATDVATAQVTRQDLTTTDEWPGTLGYIDPMPLVAARDGVLTWIPDEGTVVGLGEVVVEIDGTATRLLYGDRPAWRRLAVGEPDGADIQQLNDNLAALGYAARDALPDARFDWRTRQAVYEWQTDLGVRVTGVLELGDVVFLPSAVRIGKQDASAGAWIAAGQLLASATGTEQIITVAVDAARHGSLAEGTPVLVALPDRTRVDGTVRAVGRVVTAAEGADSRPTVDVEVVAGGLPDGLDAAPVVVTVERVLAADVLTVPVAALTAVTGGGYAVQRVTTGGSELVGVEPGEFADGLVEVTGDLAEGDQVVVPS